MGDQRLTLEKEEMTSKANYQVLMQQLTDDIKADNASIKQKTAMKAKRLEDAANAKSEKETEIEHKSNKKDQTTENIAELNKTLKLTQEELDKALDYYEKLKAECVDLGVRYEERVKMREEEIQSLQEALKVLAGEDFAF